MLDSDFTPFPLLLVSLHSRLSLLDVWERRRGVALIDIKDLAKAETVRDTGSLEPGSRPFFGSVSVS